MRVAKLITAETVLKNGFPNHSFMLRFRFILMLLVFSIVTTSCLVKSITATTYHRNLSKAPFDVVIIPGNPYDPQNPNLIFKARVLWAKVLYDKGIAKNIIFSGAAVHTPYNESFVMKLLAHRIGIPCENVFIETKARNSKENILYSVELARELGFQNIALATDPFQTIYLKKYIQSTTPNMSKLPISMDSLKNWYLDKVELPQLKKELVQVEEFVPKFSEPK